MNHKQLAELCEDSYSGTPDFSKNGVDVFMTRQADCVIFAIRGTQLNLLDLVRNIVWWPRSLGGIDAHAGHADGWQGIEDWIDIARRDLGIKDRIKPVLLTGHSAGGAIALIGAAEFLRKGWPIVECVTFGAPRTISDDMINDMGFITTQYVHARDPIPSWLGHTDYKHVRKVYVGGSESSPWWKKSLDHHGIDLYKKLTGERE